MKQNYKHYLDKRSEIMKTTPFKVEDVFCDVISKDSVSTEETTKLNNFFRKNDVNISIKKI